MAATRIMELIVRAKDEASKVLGGVGSAVDMVRAKLNSLTSMAFTIQGALAGAGLTLFAKSFLDASRETEGYRARLRILTGDVEKSNELFKAAAEYAGKVTFEYRDVMGTVTQLRGVIKGNNAEVVKWMQLTGDVAAATGVDIRTATEQISRMYSAGAQSADLFQQKGHLAMLGFTSGVSYSVEETRKKLMTMWENPLGSIKGAAADLAKTWDGMISMISDKWFATRSAIMDQGGIFNYLKAWLKAYVDYLNGFASEDAMAKWAKHTGEVVIGVFEKIAIAASYVGDSFQGWVMIWDGIKMAFGLAVSLIMEGFSLIIDGVKIVIGWMEALMEAKIKLGEAMPDWIGKGMVESAKSTLKEFAAWRETLGGVQKDMKAVAEWGDELSNSAMVHLEALVQEVPLREKIKKLLEEIRASAAEFNKEEARGSGVGGVEKKFAKQSEILKSVMDRFKADLGVEQAMLESQNAQKLISLSEYYDKRREIIMRQTQAEIDLQKAMLGTAEVQQDPNKILNVKDKIYELEKKQISDIIKLEQERREKQLGDVDRQRDIAKIIQDIKDRAEDYGNTGLAGKFNKETREMDQKHQEEIERLKKNKADQTQVNDAYRAQELEKEKLLLDQKKQLNDLYTETAKKGFGDIESAASDMYELTGKKIKAFFYIQKAAAVAQAVIATYQSAINSYNSLSGIPYVGPALGFAAAAAAVAAGIAKVAVITSQAMAGGGEVKGSSPSKTADNIKISATAGEFMQPVDSVQYYGKDVMEGIRQRIFPRAMFSGFNAPDLRASVARTHFATGGMVPGPDSQKANASKKGLEDRLTINNIVDPAIMGNYLASAPGERQFINIIAANAFQIRQAIFGS